MRRRGIHALLLATAVHVAAIGALWCRREQPAPPRPPLAVEGDPTEIEIALEEETLLPPASADAPGAVAEAARTNAVASSAVDSRSAGPGEASAVGPLAGASEEPAPEGWALRPSTIDLHLGVNGRAPTALGVVPVDPNEPAPLSKNGGLSESLAARDREIGLARGGAARTAVAKIVQGANVMGIATFAIGVDSSGKVSVSLVGASSDYPGWNDLSSAIQGEVEAVKDKIRIAPNSRGLKVIVRAEAIDRYVDGRPPPKKAVVADATIGKITETKDKVDITPPSASVGIDGKVCSVRLGVGLMGPGLSGGCSPEVAGTTPVRTVATRIVDESAM